MGGVRLNKCLRGSLGAGRHRTKHGGRGTPSPPPGSAPTLIRPSPLTCTMAAVATSSETPSGTLISREASTTEYSDEQEERGNDSEDRNPEEMPGFPQYSTQGVLDTDKYHRPQSAEQRKEIYQVVTTATRPLGHGFKALVPAGHAYPHRRHPVRCQSRPPGRPHAQP